MPSSACKKCALDRKSTRLNSSHTLISYAVFCLKKKTAHPRLRTGGDLPPLRPAHHAQPLRPTRVAICGAILASCVRLTPDSGYFFFFFNDTAPPEIYPLSLPDALPINDTATTEIYPLSLHDASDLGGRRIIRSDERRAGKECKSRSPRSEEHTSEL